MVDLGGSPEALRNAMRQLASGVSVVTAVYQGKLHAMTATAVCSVSLDPPLILVCVSRRSRFHDAISEAESWCVSLLATSQESVARHFSNGGRDLDTQFDRVDHRPAPYGGAPVLAAALTWLECSTYARYDGGDHLIVVGQLRAAGGPPAEEAVPAAPLTYYRGSYSSIV